MAETLAGMGCNLFLGARNLSRLQEVKDEISGVFPDIEIHVRSVDFSKKFETEQFAQAALNHWGSVDILINNVGTFAMGNLGEESHLERMMTLNFEAAYRLTSTLLPTMKASNKAHIFTVCSVLSKEARAGSGDYTISKHALYGMHKTLLEECRGTRCYPTAFISGSINTSTWDGMDVPRDEFVQPEDMARAVEYIVNAQPGTRIEEITFKPLNPDY